MDDGKEELWVISSDSGGGVEEAYDAATASESDEDIATFSRYGGYIVAKATVDEETYHK